ncbi:hypothetical protein RPN53_13810 [Pseudomonas putida]
MSIRTLHTLSSPALALPALPRTPLAHAVFIGLALGSCTLAPIAAHADAANPHEAAEEKPAPRNCPPP